MKKIERKHLLTVLRGARSRVAHAFNPNYCQCEEHEHRKPWPVAEGHTWCPLCAIEAEQCTQRFAPDYYMAALNELALTLDPNFVSRPGREGDRPVISWSFSRGKPAVVKLFEQAIAKLEAQSA